MRDNTRKRVIDNTYLTMFTFKKLNAFHQL